MRSVVLLFSFCAALSAQTFGIGIKLGTSLTDALNAASASSPGSAIRYFNQNRKFTVGPMVELRIPLLAFEADALYKPVKYTVVQSPALTTGMDVSASEWDFPLLAKLRLPIPIVKPYAAAGVAFRAFTGNHPELNAQSNKGFVLGAGIDIKAVVIHISPELRYTRWGAHAFRLSEFPGIDLLQAKPNQLEFLIGFSR